MSLSEDIECLSKRFVQCWPAYIHCVEDNQPEADVEVNSVWCRFSIQPGSELREVLGRNGPRVRTGYLYLQIFTPMGMGTGEAIDIAETFADTYDEWVSDDYAVRCEKPRHSTPGDTGDGWFETLVSVPWRSTRTRC